MGLLGTFCFKKKGKKTFPMQRVTKQKQEQTMFDNLRRGFTEEFKSFFKKY